MRPIEKVRVALIATLLLVTSAAALWGTTASLGYWRFEEGTPDTLASGAGSVIDSSPSGDNGTPVGSPVYRADVPVNPVPYTGAANASSLEFDSSDDKVVYSSTFPFNQPGDVTLEFWLKYPGTSHQAVLWGRSDSNDTNRFHVYVNPDSTVGVDYIAPSGSFHTVVGGGGPSGGAPVPANVWTHFALTREGNTYRSYVNGVMTSVQTDVLPDLPTGAGWSLSGRGGFEFQGSLDEVRLSSGALVPGQFLRDSPPVLAVSIDIKPGRSDNPLNPRARGVIPVAILTTGIFDASTVDASTVRFGATGTEAAPVQTVLEDVDGDADLDLVLHFTTQQTGIACGATSAVLTGQTAGGQSIQGSDALQTVGCTSF